MKSESDTEVVQKINLEGTWGITALTYVTQGGTQNVYMNEIKNGQAVNDFYFMKNGKFKQICDMSGSGTMANYEGTWKITGTILILNLYSNGIQTDVVYTCEQKSDLLILTFIGPDGTVSFVITLKKK